jgi:hypothetical protein
LVDGSFGLPDTIAGADGEPINVGSASAPCVSDWDSDGDLDLLVGEITGSMYYIENIGSARAPEYATPEKMKAAGKELMVGGDAGPVVTDWDADGDLDLIVGDGKGAVYLFKNTPADGEPVLGSRVELVNGRSYKEDPETGEFGLEPGSGLHPDEMGSRAKLAVCDWNADGAKDLLVGDFSSELGPEPELTEEQMAKKARLLAEQDEISDEMSANWKRVRDAALEAIGEQRADEARDDYNERLWEKEEELRDSDEDYTRVTQRSQTLYSELAPLRAKSVYHGYVWVYLRKPRS